MSKVRNFAERAPNIGFSEFDFYDLYRSTFENSELGRRKKLLPLHEMAENFRLARKSMRSKLGRELTEILDIFFGLHTANVVQLTDRIEQRAQLALA